MSAVDQLVERWSTDEQFRDEFRADPEGTVRGSGIELTDEQWEAVRGMDASDMNDGQLQDRVNKCG